VLKQYLNEAIETLIETAVLKVSAQKAIDGAMFGPLYHGTTEDNRKKIEADGFKIFVGSERSGDISNGYQSTNYGFTGIAPPIHHLGFGIYFTTSKTIAKKYAYGSAKGMASYYIDTPQSKILEINFGSPNTMMKWWIANGYDPELAKKDRVEATVKMTNELSKKYDAVWFKGKGLYRLLDGDQVCVFDPKIIRRLDDKLANKGEIGSRVVATADIFNKYAGVIVRKGTKGVFMGSREINPEHRHFHNGETTWVTIKWQKGGTQQVYASQVEFL
jgi:hypothetical protein